MRNGALGLLSTAVSGLSNVLVQLLVAALTTTIDFAEFTLVSTTILLMLGLGRSVLGQTDMIRGSASLDKGAVSAAYGFSATVFAVGALVGGLGLLLDVPLVSIVGYGVFLSSIFILQDALRFRSLRMSRAGVALFSDCIVLAVSLGGILLADAAGVLSELAATIWGAATFFGFLAAAAPLGYWGRPSFLPLWIRQNRDVIRPMAAEYALQSALPYALNWILLAVGGYAALAGYRIIQLVFAAVSNFAQGINAAVLPGIVNRRSAEFAQRRTRAEGFLIASVAVLATVVILVTPPSAGAAIFGSAWLAVGAFAWPGAVHGAMNALAISSASVLRLVGLANYSLTVRFWTVALSLLLVSIGVFYFGPVGAAWGMAIGAVAGFLARFVRSRLALAQLIRAGVPPWPAST